MKKCDTAGNFKPASLSKSRCKLFAIALAVTFGSMIPVANADSKPEDAAGDITIGVLYASKAAQGISLRNAAEMAVREINEDKGIAGRKIVLKAYDSAMDPSEGVRVMQRAVSQDGAVAIIGIFSSDVAIALMPWAKRLNVPLIVSGGTTTELPRLVRKDYDRYRNVFRVGITNSDLIAKSVSDFARDILSKELGLKSVAVVTEEAAWSVPYTAALKNDFEKTSGLQAQKWLKVPTDLKDFTAVYSEVAKANVDAVLTGFAYTGLTPAVQWSQLKPAPYMAGVSSQATGGDFYKKSNGAAEGLISWTQAARAPISPKTEGFVDRFVKQYGDIPLFTAFATFDALHVYKDAVERSGTTDTEKVIESLEKTDYVGVTGRIKLGAADSEYPHDTMYGPGLVTGVATQWQRGKLEVVWPAQIATKPVQRVK